MKARCLFAGFIHLNLCFFALYSQDPLFPKGSYFSFHAGSDLFKELKVADKDRSSDAAKLKTKAGLTGFFTLGYRLDEHFRFDIEVGKSYNSIKNAIIAPSTDTSAIIGRVSAWRYLFNSIYSFQTNRVFDPYLGFGIGIARNLLNVAIPFSGSFATIDAAKTSFAYQAILGATKTVSKITQFSVDYRHLRTNHIRMYSLDDRRFSVKGYHHLFTIGLTFLI